MGRRKQMMSLQHFEVVANDQSWINRGALQKLGAARRETDRVRTDKEIVRWKKTWHSIPSISPCTAMD